MGGDKEPAPGRREESEVSRATCTEASAHPEAGTVAGIALFGRPLAALALVAAALSGCGSPAKVTRPPQAVLRDYTAALKRGDLKAAYPFLSEAFRQRYSEKQFVQMVRSDPGWFRHNVEQLSKGVGDGKLLAIFPYGEGESLRLVFERGSWRIASDPTQFYSQRTPEAALRSFVKAVERKRYDVVLRFVPSRWREAMTVDKLKARWEGGKQEEIRALLGRIKAKLGEPMQKNGDTATLSLGENSEVRLVRENGLWMVDDAF